MAVLREGIKASPTDADVLIAMHRVQNPPDDWQRMTQASIHRAAILARQAIGTSRAMWQATNSRMGVTHESARKQLAQKLNQ